MQSFERKKAAQNGTESLYNKMFNSSMMLSPLPVLPSLVGADFPFKFDRKFSMWLNNIFH